MTAAATRSGIVTLKGNPVTLVGPELGVGDKAPDFTLRAMDLSTKTLSDYSGKVKILTVVPSLDTAVCDVEVRKFNEQADALGDGVVVLTVSVDLPMAQKRWCGAAGVERVHCLSDFYDHSFGKAYGVRMQENGLLARAVFVIDRDDVIRYVQIVPEIATEPDYDPVLAAARELA